MAHRTVNSINKKILVGILCLHVFSCICIFLFLEGSLLPFKACRPIMYNQTERIKISEGQRVSYITDDSIEEVLSFYDRTLTDLQYNIISPGYTGQWKKWYYSGYIHYDCYGNDINFLTGEVGCIYISREGDGTVIEARRYRGTTPCPRR